VTEICGSINLHDYGASLLPKLRAGWDDLLKTQFQQPSFLQGPEYFDHLATMQHSANIFLATMDNGETELVGLVPVRKMPVALDFCIGHTCFASARFRGLRVLGGNIIWPTNDQLHVHLMEKLVVQFPEVEVVQFSGVKTDSPIWKLLTKCPEIASRFDVYIPYGIRQCINTHIPDQLDQYLANIGSKKRYNLTRQLKQFAKNNQDQLELKRIESTDDVFYLTESIDHSKLATENGLAMRNQELMDLANRGLLLSYVLISHNRPYAFALGHRYQTTLFVHKFWHDRNFDIYSPGACLHYLMMQDIITNKLAHRIDYGFGMPQHGAGRANYVEERANVLLFKKQPRSKLCILAHSQLQRAVNAVKLWIK
jgi:hypothetical protein